MYPHWLPERDINKYFKKSVIHILVAEYPWILYLRKKNDSMHPAKTQRYTLPVLPKAGHNSAVQQLEDGQELCCNDYYTAIKRTKGTDPKQDTKNRVPNA